MDLVPCHEESCRRLSTCVTSRLWATAAETLRKFLEGATIGDLAEEVREREAGRPLSYEI